MKVFAPLLFLGLAGLSSARTDLLGCISSATTNQWHEASMIWYVEDTGEICDFPDCGGGRAPPKTDQPGCPLYSGTATLTPSYLLGWGPNGKMAATSSTASETATSSSSSSSSKIKATDNPTESTTIQDSMVTRAPTFSPIVSMTSSTSPISKASNSTSSATTTTGTGNAAGISSANMAGAMAIVMAVVGGIAL
ncbi:hypothetical protein N7532_011943 [Penicillium argentinense]|uniref:Siderophore biosynthesis enzyme n=1 Tax=Penicillium argentinense TaxID=1131581 RepID=A0A9W9EJI6_9EURO|nr:uncharacterized protein N7532_011943 [Penicillium argentinense]KAJ5082900.1 hypothetical protein N7532_011943 [Penicillium argentinense]